MPDLVAVSTAPGRVVKNQYLGCLSRGACDAKALASPAGDIAAPAPSVSSPGRHPSEEFPPHGAARQVAHSSSRRHTGCSNFKLSRIDGRTTTVVFLQNDADGVAQGGQIISPMSRCQPPCLPSKVVHRAARDQLQQCRFRCRASSR